MGELTLANYQESVITACGNIPAAHPVIARGMHTKAINKAPNYLIRALPNHFPEHKDNTWTVGPTVVGNNLVDLPENLVILKKVRCSNEVVVTGSDWTAIQEYVVVLIDGSVIGLLDKSATITGYPTMCARKANALLYNVTTQTGFTTFFRLYGDAGEVPLVGAGETFRMHRDYDELIVQIATANTLKYIPGRSGESAEIMNAVRTELSEMRGDVATERAAKPMRMTVAGMPPL